MTDEIKDNETGEEGFDDEFAKMAAEKDGTKLEPVFTVEPGNQEDLEPDKDKPADDPYSGMGEATKARFTALEESNQQLQHRIDSDDGRVGALQKKINGLEEQLTAANKPAATEEEITAAMATDEGWELFKDEYAEQALAIEGYMDKRLANQDAEISSKINKVNETIAPVTERIAEQDANDAYGKVEEEYPGWQDEVKSSTFNTWFESQNAAVQNMANSDDAKDASDLMGLYDNYRVTSNLEPLRNTDHGNTVVDNSVDEIAERRSRQLEDGAAIKSKSARIDPSSDTGGEFETAFDAFAKRKDAKQA